MSDDQNNTPNTPDTPRTPRLTRKHIPRSEMTTKAILKRHAGVFLALKHDDVCDEVRDLLDTYSSDVIAEICEACKIDPLDMDVFLYAHGELSIKQLTSVMSNLNYRCIFQKAEVGELSNIAPERLLQHVRVMQELNILNNMRANKAEDELADAKAASKPEA